MVAFVLRKNNIHYKGKTSGEARRRSIAKSLTWRLFGTIDTIIISYLITDTLTFALSIGSIELISKMVLYYFHERTWEHIEWGK